MAHIITTKRTSWKPFKGRILPESARNFSDKGDIFRYNGHWLMDAIFYKGDTPETATDWIIVTDDGGYYKCFAKFGIWHTSQKGEVVLQCIWSVAHLKRSLKSLIETGKTIPDPGYHT
jgi:hypothetical protein